MDMDIVFPGGARVDAQFGEFTVQTDQPLEAGGTLTAPTPFSLFLASIGTCAGIYVLGFCRQRGIPMDGIKLHQRANMNPATGMVEIVELEIQLPPGFPPKYEGALLRAAEQCAVKKHLEVPPSVTVTTAVPEPAR